MNNALKSLEMKQFESYEKSVWNAITNHQKEEAYARQIKLLEYKQ